MEHDPLKFFTPRWSQIIGLTAIGCFGLLMLYWSTFGDNPIKNADGDLFLRIFGGMFILFGFLSATVTFFIGVTYTRLTKCPLEELNYYKQHSNGLMVSLGNYAKLLTYKHEKLVERGYIKLVTNFNRKKEYMTWYFVID